MVYHICSALDVILNLLNKETLPKRNINNVECDTKVTL